MGLNWENGTVSVLPLVSFFFLLVIHVLPWVFRRRTSIAKSPAKLTMLLSGIQFLPQFLILAIEPSRSLLTGFSETRFREILSSFGILYSIGLLFFLYGLLVGGRILRVVAPLSWREFQVRNGGALIAFLLALYIACIYQIFSLAGGLTFFLANIGARASLLAGTGVYFILTSPASYLIIFFAILSHHQNGKPNLILVLGLIVLVTGIESLLGGRRQPVQMLLFAALCFSLLSAKKTILTLPNMLLVILATLLFAVLLFARIGPTESLDLVNVILNLSHVDVYLFILDHFQDHTYWLGQSFGDLINRVFPNAVTTEPPPIDDGVYIYNLYLGFEVFPPTPMDTMVWNSWPPGTFGSGYMNFGPIGVLGFFFVRGLIVGAAFEVSRKSNYSPALLLIYLWVAFGFQISNLKIAQLLMLLAGLAVLFPLLAIINRASFTTRLPKFPK